MRFPLSAFAASLIGLSAMSGCLSVASPMRPALAGASVLPNAAETRYIRDTARAVYRSHPAERTLGFVSADSSTGYAICLRVRGRNGAYDHTLLILQRRITDGVVSQVEDDAQILRATRDVGVCRDREDWVEAR